MITCKAIHTRNETYNIKNLPGISQIVHAQHPDCFSLAGEPEEVIMTP